MHDDVAEAGKVQIGSCKAEGSLSGSRSSRGRSWVSLRADKMYGGLVHQVAVGPALLTGASYGPEAGLIGIGFRLILVALLLGWWYWRQQRPINHRELSTTSQA
jgi:hypothetical protein